MVDNSGGPAQGHYEDERHRLLKSRQGKPTLVVFCCNYCSYEGADKAGMNKKEYPANVRIVRTMCSGRVEPNFVLEAFKDGADGVLVLGCHPGDCHFKKGNYKAQRRYFLLKKMLKQFGVSPDRYRLDWVSASEGDKFVKVVTEMSSDITEMGHLKLEV